MEIIGTIADKHRLLSLPQPFHPLISVVRVADVRAVDDPIWQRFALNFYCIALKRNVKSKMQYGQQRYDHDKGILTFIAPKQVLSLNGPPVYETGEDAGYALFFNAEFLHDHPLASKIRTYGFFSYMTSEALHLSEKEEKCIGEIFLKIEEELQQSDQHSKDVILAQIELILSYSKRYYERQFISRKTVSHAILTKIEQLMNDYFDGKEALNNGIPTVEYLAVRLNLSPHYFSDVLRSLTGESALHHIQEKLVDKAKEYLSVTDLTVSEIAYKLGFKHPQSLSKLFRRKTNISPLVFRRNLITLTRTKPTG
ncbi:helix-turn-helix domain-containing protein [Mucilaginibacter sp. UR6-1]|uniref:helix-turn-helix domain-containing protein n=1 Tax=Mucilaginibacter sp. UR6-1 TaxID=1435643 RepID=UPI001E4455B1|nr:helix-turn-helix domain-containing protein [Mucilaginibacter sp. UR6-1]MCC8407508.1 helix-turn-helix domain-containing protein [Mucilaginibacter sp. UR6-1]